MMKAFRLRRKRSALSLMASGFATISLDQSLQTRRLRTTREALQGDWDAVSNDGRRSLNRVMRELESA